MRAVQLIFQTRKSILEPRTRSPVRADSSLASATLWHWTTASERQIVAGRNHGDTWNNEDECPSEWIDREIARQRGIRTQQRGTR